MKTISKRAKLVISVMLVAVLVAISAVIVIFAQDKATFEGVQVATDGNINLRFYYTDVDASVTRAKVVLSDAGIKEAPFYVDLETTSGGKTYFNVPLAAAQMGYDVIVTPVDAGGNGACASKTYSVRGYGEKVLKNADHSEYYSAVKSILNYGTYASDYFADSHDIVNEVVENEGIYSRLTNPAINMAYELGTASKKTPTVTGADVSDAWYEIVLDSAIELRLHYTYTGSGHAEGVKTGANTYYVYIANIDTANYAKQYTLAADVNGVEAVSVTTTVIECLQVLAAKTETADIAHAMYYYYLNTAKTAPARTDCTHHRQHYEATALGADTSTAVCSYCGKVMSGAISDDVNYYSAPGQQVNIQGVDGSTVTGTPVGTVMTEGDLTFTRITVTDGDAFEFRNGSTEVKPVASQFVVSDSVMGGSGKYIVMKYRYSQTPNYNQGCLHLAMLADNVGRNQAGASTLGQNMQRFGGAYSVSNMTLDAWDIYVIDIEKLACSFYGADKADVKKAAYGMTFSYLGTSRVGTLDIAYFAICDNLDEIASVVGNDTTVNVVDWKNEKAAINTSVVTGMCTGNHSYTPVVANGKYTHTCKNSLCSGSIAINADINYYSAPGQYYNAWNASGLGGTCAVAGTVRTENGVTYQHITLAASAYFEFTNGSIMPQRGLSINGYHNNSTQYDVGDTVNGGSGNYFVLKIRGNAVDSLKWYLNATDDGGKQTNTWGNYVTETPSRTVTSELTADKWMIYVVDIASFGSAPYPAGDKTAERVAVGLGIESGVSGTEYLDIAYFAICDDWTEIEAVVGNENVYFMNGWKNATPSERHSDGSCVNCTLSLTKNGDVYSYECTVCGMTYDDFTVNSSVNYYTAPGQFKSVAWGTSLDSTLRGDGEVAYQRFTISNVGGTLPLTTGGHVKANAGYFVDLNGGTGKYIVLKMRTHNVTALNWRLSSASDTVSEAEPSGNYIGRKTDFANDEWATYVVDIAELIALQAGIDTTYGQAGDTTRTSIAAGFMYGTPGGAAPSGVYVDVSYFAICDSWEEVAVIASNEEKVYYTAWANNAAMTERHSDGACMSECVLTLDEADTSSFKYVCSVCNSEYVRTVDSSVNFYSAPGQTSNNWAAGTPGGSTATMNHDIRTENGRVFERISLAAGASFRFDNTSVATPSRRFPAVSTVTGGSGKYIVIRFRAHNWTAGEYLAWTLNTDTSAQGSNTNFNSSDTNASVYRNNDIENGVWKTYVIDITAMNHAYYKADDSGVSKIAIGLYLNKTTAVEGKAIDVEYVAVCDSWEEIDSIVEESTVQFSGWSDGSSWVTVNTATGPLVLEDGVEDSVLFEKNGEKMYVYVRSNVEGVNKYTRYEFKRMVDANTKFDSWKISMIDICDDKLQYLYTTVQGACELEAALQEKLNYGQGSAAADFIGGYHGDEYMTGIKVLVDGEELDMNADYALTACESVQAIVESYLNRCSANTTTDEKVFDRVKIDTWTKDGLVIYNKFTATDDIFIQRPATSMIAIKFGNGLITEYRNTNLDWTEIEDFQSQNGVSLNFDTSSVTWAEMRGKLNVRVEMSDYTINGRVPTTGWGNFSHDYFGADARRVKIYIEPFYMEQLYEGDVFECTSTQSIFAAE